MIKCCKFKSRDFDTRITIERKTFSQNADGSASNSWTTYTQAWVKFENLRMRERLEADQLQYKYTHKVYARYNTTLIGATTGDRVVIGARYFNIIGIQDMDEQKHFIKIDLQESKEAST